MRPLETRADGAGGVAAAPAKPVPTARCLPTPTLLRAARRTCRAAPRAGSTLTYRPGDIWYQMTGPNTNDSRKIITTPAYGGPRRGACARPSALLAGACQAAAAPGTPRPPLGSHLVPTAPRPPMPRPGLDGEGRAHSPTHSRPLTRSRPPQTWTATLEASRSASSATSWRPGAQWRKTTQCGCGAPAAAAVYVCFQVLL